MTFPVSPATPGRHQAGPPIWHPGHSYHEANPVARGGENPPPGPVPGYGPWQDPNTGWGYRPGEPPYPPGPGYVDPNGGRGPAAAAAPPPSQPVPDFAEPGPQSEGPSLQGHAWLRSDLEDRSWADRRYAVASTVKQVNAKHTHEAFDRFGKKGALAPHGVILFYELPRRAPGGQQVGYELFKVIRLFLDGPESADLFRVLDDLRISAESNISRAITTRQRWDPRGPEGSMVNSGDMGMPREARYLGVAVETLNTDHGDWYTVARSLQNQPFGGRSVFDLPGQGFVLLIDGTAMYVRRDPTVRSFNDNGIRASKPLDVQQARWHNRYADLMEQGDQPTRMTWAYLNQLHETLGTYLLGRPPA